MMLTSARRHPTALRPRRLLPLASFPPVKSGSANLAGEGSCDDKISLRPVQGQAVTRVIPESNRARKGGDRQWQPAL